MNRHSIAILLHAVCPILGVDPDKALQTVPWPASTTLGADLTVSGSDFITFWNTIFGLAGTKADLMFLGRTMANGPVLPIFLAFSIAPNLGEGLRRLARYKTLFGPVALELSSHKGGLRLEIVAEDPALALPETLAIPIGIFVIEKARSHSARNIVPTQLLLPGHAPEDGELAGFFGTQPEHGGNVAIEFSEADVRAPFLSENNDLWLEIENDLEEQLNRRIGGKEFHHEIESAIRRALTIGPVRVEAICDELGVSRSTMQRRLASEGLSYQQILDSVRKELAVRYLSKSMLMPAQIARLVGFTDPKSFHRAFKSWTSQPPEMFRKAVQKN